MLYSRSEHNIVNQLYFNKKKIHPSFTCFERSFQLDGGLGWVFLRTGLCLTHQQRVNSQKTQPLGPWLGGSSVLAQLQTRAQDILNAGPAHGSFQEQEGAQLPPGFQQRAWEGASQNEWWLNVFFCIRELGWGLNSAPA